MPRLPASRRTRRPLPLVAALALLAVAAHADGDHRRRDTAPMPAAYRQECGACHTAFPARLLPAASWQRLMADLPRHFGTDASLDAATARPLADWLAANAGSGKRAEPPPQDRISRAAWFVREHREVPVATWRSPAVRSAAQCSACHTTADQGSFDEHAVRLPR